MRYVNAQDIDAQLEKMKKGLVQQETCCMIAGFLTQTDQHTRQLQTPKPFVTLQVHIKLREDPLLPVSLAHLRRKHQKTTGKSLDEGGGRCPQETIIIKRKGTNPLRRLPHHKGCVC